MKGVVKKIVLERAFGFIRDEKGVEWFFHRSGVAPGVDFLTLSEGDQVTFEEQTSNKGPRAVNVQRI